MTQAIGYVRRSTDKQDESLDQQRAKLEAFAKSKGWQLVHVYTDDAITGSDMHRPGLKALIDRAERDASVGAVVAWDRNRLARPKDPVEGMLLERRLLAAGKRVMYAGTGQESDRSFASGLLGYVEHYQNGDYLRKLSRDTMRGLISRVQRGRWPGGPIPFGFDRLILDEAGNAKRIVRDLDNGSQAVIDPASGAIVERLAGRLRHHKQDHESCAPIPSDEPRVRAVQKLFADYATGVPSRKLREWLNASGFRTSRGGKFTIPTILPILENPAYLGRCVYNRRTLSKWHAHAAGQSVERRDERIERRPQADWIVTENAWAAIVDAETWQRVQERREASKEKSRQVVGHAVRANYLLTGRFFCGVCGSLMTGQTCTSGKGYRTRYYVCSCHHRGDRERCGKRYTVPADVVESHLVELIKSDLAKLRDDDQLHRYVAEEVKRITGSQDDAAEQLQRRLAELDQQIAKIRDHLKALDTATAQALGVYDDAKQAAAERQQVELELSKVAKPTPALPDLGELRRRASAAFERLDAVLAGGTLEEKRELIGCYVQKIKADPDRQSVHISLYPGLFSPEIAGASYADLKRPQTMSDLSGFGDPRFA